MDSFYFIVNPVAGKGRGKHALDEINRFMKNKNYEYKISQTMYQGHAKELAVKESPGYNHIISVGGDGTLNEIINGIDLESEKILAVIPVGSGNDFALNLNISKNINENLDLIFNHQKKLSSFKVGMITLTENNNYVDEIRTKDHRFVNALGIGFDAYVAHLNQKNKVFRGILSYIYAVIRAVLKYTPLNIKCRIDNDNLSGRKLLLTVGNGKTSGGGFYLTPNAKIDDTQFEICLIDFVKRFKLIRSLPLALINKIDKVKEVSLKKFSNAEIFLENPYFVHTDGEVISGTAVELKVTCIKNNLKVIIGDAI